MIIYDAITPGQDPAGKLAEMVVGTRYEDLPSDMIEQAKKAIFDTIAVTIAGSKWECSPLVADMVKQWGGSGESKVLIYGYKAPAPLAAFANGAMARAIDMGDVHATGGHVTEWIVPPLLSALGIAKKKITGKEFITAYLVAAELGIRYHTCIGLHKRNVCIPGECAGSMYSTAAVSKLLDSNVEQTWNALGIAFSVHSLAEGQKYAEGTQMIRLQHGFGADTGIKATLLAQGGATGPKGIFLGSAAALRHIIWDDVNPDILTTELGKKWLFYDGLSLKPYSSCKFTHSLISAMMTLKRKHNIDYRQIVQIHCIISKGASVCVEPKELRWNPTNAAEALFSIPYAVAHAALSEKVFLDAFSEAELKRPEKRELMKRITAEIDLTIESPFEGYTVEVILQNGEKFHETDQCVLGHPKNPMSWDDLKQKFWNCVPYSAVQLPEGKFQEAVNLCANLDALTDLNKLVESLTP